MPGSFDSALSPYKPREQSFNPALFLNELWAAEDGKRPFPKGVYPESVMHGPQAELVIALSIPAWQYDPERRALPESFYEWNFDVGYGAGKGKGKAKEIEVSKCEEVDPLDWTKPMVGETAEEIAKRKKQEVLSRACSWLQADGERLTQPCMTGYERERKRRRLSNGSICSVDSDDPEFYSDDE
ncbi:hypothetical protein Moror_6176 [Moniliophthora roreri MCA 2997]|uniref:Uncharacterized protein n=2 Tax=Moniliophthora roreri TaxID=221103 RepID=V2WV88_MONRO|nr:hypothetical protein Moror_6176 [Moniliophthora roreri MCA 2997]KAI3606064.1 hypothetical protein WG66_003978 [Moniliophthora roreri]